MERLGKFGEWEIVALVHNRPKGLGNDALSELLWKERESYVEEKRVGMMDGKRPLARLFGIETKRGRLVGVMSVRSLFNSRS